MCDTAIVSRYYLKGKHKYEKQENTDDIDLARGLLQKAIELDDNLIMAKTLLGWICYEVEDYDKAMKIYKESLNQMDVFSDYWWYLTLEPMYLIAFTGEM